MKLILKTKHPEFIEWKWIDNAQMLPKVIIVDFKKNLYRKILVKRN